MNTVFEILFYVACAVVAITTIVIFTTKSWPEENQRK